MNKSIGWSSNWLHCKYIYLEKNDLFLFVLWQDKLLIRRFWLIYIFFMSFHFYAAEFQYPLVSLGTPNIWYEIPPANLGRRYSEPDDNSLAHKLTPAIGWTVSLMMSRWQGSVTATSSAEKRKIHQFSRPTFTMLVFYLYKKKIIISCR